MRRVDEALATLPAGWRLCVHPPATRADRLSGEYTIRVEVSLHRLAPDERCDAGRRTEYGPAPETVTPTV